MIPYRELEGVRPVHNPMLIAIRTCVEAHGFARKPITPGLLKDVGSALTRATRTPCVAFHEIDLVPAADGMVRVRIQHEGGPWVLTTFRSPGRAS